MTQATIRQATDDGPEIGVELDERTHYAHTRYAASETPGVIWYDPRDGNEYYALEDVAPDAEIGFDDRELTSIRLHGHRKRCQIIDPSTDQFVVEYSVKTREVFEKPPGIDDIEYVTTYGGSDVYEDVYTARAAAAEMCEGYASAERKNAVTHRTEADQ